MNDPSPEVDVPDLETREDSLTNADFPTIQSLASMLDVYQQGDTARDLRRKLAREGVFYGPVGDNAIYQFDGDEVKMVKEP